MELDKEIKQTIIRESRKYLEGKRIPYRHITIRNGIPVVIVDERVFYNILDKNLDGDRIIGRYIAQGNNGWSAYKRDDAESSFNLKESMTEYQATCWVTDQEFGRKPKTSRYAMGGMA